jgi:hypothetical protein
MSGDPTNTEPTNTEPTNTEPADSTATASTPMSTEQMSQMSQMSTEQMIEEPQPASSGWLWDHIGRLTGLLLGACAFGFLVFLALIGSKPALGLVVVLVAGFAMIALGGVMRGEMRSH